MRIRFVDVGRDRKTWEAELPGRREPIEEIYSAVVKAKVLKSRGVEVVANDDGVSGVILAGAHKVGRFEVVGSAE